MPKPTLDDRTILAELIWRSSVSPVSPVLPACRASDKVILRSFVHKMSIYSTQIWDMIWCTKYKTNTRIKKKLLGADYITLSTPSSRSASEMKKQKKTTTKNKQQQQHIMNVCKFIRNPQIFPLYYYLHLMNAQHTRAKHSNSICRNIDTTFFSFFFFVLRLDE